MKYRLTLLILCFAFAANAQINFGVSVSEGMDKVYHPNFQTANIGVPHEGIYLFNGFKKHRIAESIGLKYSPFSYKGEITFTNIAGDIIGSGKLFSINHRVSCPIQMWGTVYSKSKLKLGLEAGVLGEFAFKEIIYGKNIGITKNNVPVNGYSKIDSKSLNNFYCGGEFGVFSAIKFPKNYLVIFNIGINYSKCFSSQNWDFASVFFKVIAIFGK